MEVAYAATNAPVCKQSPTSASLGHHSKPWGMIPLAILLARDLYHRCATKATDATRNTLCLAASCSGSMSFICLTLHPHLESQSLSSSRSSFNTPKGFSEPCSDRRPLDTAVIGLEKYLAKGIEDKTEDMWFSHPCVYETAPNSPRTALVWNIHPVIYPRITTGVQRQG